LSTIPWQFVYVNIYFHLKKSSSTQRNTVNKIASLEGSLSTNRT